MRLFVQQAQLLFLVLLWGPPPHRRKGPLQHRLYFFHHTGWRFLYDVMWE